MAKQHQTPITIGDLYPELSEDEQQIAGENLLNYLSVIVKIAERLENTGNNTEHRVDTSFDDVSNWG